MIELNVNITQLKPSATLAINQEVKHLKNNDVNVFHFGFGQSPFPVYKSIVKALKDNAEKSSYLPTVGLEALRKQIALFLNQHQAIKADWENILIGPGSKELLYQAILILEGEFLIPKGSWVSYLPQVLSKNGKYHVLETMFENDFKLNAKVLDHYCRQKKEKQYVLILNSPNNPTGAIYSENELMDIAEVCKSHNIIVLSDEIYSQINFNNTYSPSISKYYPERTIVFGGLSKVFAAGGYRLGFMFLPKGLKVLNIVFRSLFSETFSAVAAPIQFAAIKAFEMKPKLQKHLQRQNYILNTVASFVYSELQSVNIDCTKPMGAFYMMIGFSKYTKQLKTLGITTNISLGRYLLKNYNVALLPGSDFYFNDGDFFLRLAFVDFDGKDPKRFPVKIYTPRDMEQYFSNVYHGVNALKLFIKDLV